MEKIFKISADILSNDLLSWEEKLILSKIKCGNEFYKGNFKPTIKFFSNELGMTESKIKFCLLKLISIGLITYKYIDKEVEGSYYNINNSMLNDILEEKISFIKKTAEEEIEDIEQYVEEYHSNL